MCFRFRIPFQLGGQSSVVCEFLVHFDSRERQTGRQMDGQTETYRLTTKRVWMSYTCITDVPYLDYHFGILKRKCTKKCYIHSFTFTLEGEPGPWNYLQKILETLFDLELLFDSLHINLGHLLDTWTDEKVHIANAHPGFFILSYLQMEENEKEINRLSTFPFPPCLNSINRRFNTEWVTEAPAPAPQR